MTTGNEALSGFTQNTNRAYDTAEQRAKFMGLEQSLQPIPEQPTFGDYALPVGTALARYGLMKQQPQALEPASNLPGGGVEAPLYSPAKADVSSPEPLADTEIAPNTPFHLGESPQTEKTFKVKPSDVRFGFNDNGVNPRLAAYRGLRRGSVFGY